MGRKEVVRELSIIRSEFGLQVMNMWKNVVS